MMRNAGIRLLRAAIVCVMVAVAVVGQPCGAATLLNVNVVPDGSVDPPGDRIDVTVLFDPGEDELALETRAYVRLQGSADPVVPVASRDERSSDPEGHFQSTVVLKRPADSRQGVQPIVIPYASLKLPVGRHQIGYEIRGLRGGRVEFVRPTPLTTVVVSERIRSELRRTEEKTVSQSTQKRMTAYVFKDGKVIPQEIEVASEQAIKTLEVRTAKVAIPGEFARPRPVTTRGRPTGTGGEEPAGRSALVPLEGQAWAPLSEFESKPKRTAYFATNRNVLSPETLAPARFGAEASPALTYGSCLVNIPIANHTRGQVEVPSYWWQSRDPGKYFLIESLEVLARDRFLKQVAPDDVLLFIHGYNTDFESAVLRSAQLVHDLRFPGKGLAFSWPSAGALSKYGADEGQAEKSTSALVEVFRLLSPPAATKGAVGKIHVIVHSMGNRVFLSAIRQYERESPARPPRKIFGHVALAAPDVDAATFAALLPSVLRQSDTATLYYCQSDRALLASQTLHMNKPVGLGPFFADGLDTINCDNANTSLLGHDYYASTHPLLIDLRLAILFGAKPDDRFPPLGHHTLYLGYPHWSFLPPR
jgi:esterase/lipase superfamily enzyme